MEMLELAGNNTLGDTTITILLDKLFSARPDIVYIDPSSLCIVIDGVVSFHTQIFKELVSGLTTEVILLPINCKGIHWCSIMVSLDRREVTFYDPMYSSFSDDVRDVAKSIIPLLPEPVQSRYRVRRYESDLGAQTDSYNCGVFVMTAFELFCGANLPFEGATSGDMQYLRYRYLCMGFDI